MDLSDRARLAAALARKEAAELEAKRNAEQEKRDQELQRSNAAYVEKHVRWAVAEWCDDIGVDFEILDYRVTDIVRWEGGATGTVNDWTYHPAGWNCRVNWHVEGHDFEASVEMEERRPDSIASIGVSVAIASTDDPSGVTWMRANTLEQFGEALLRESEGPNFWRLVTSDRSTRCDWNGWTLDHGN